MRRYTIEEKRTHVETFLDSGMSRSEYCRIHGIPLTTIMRWVDEGVRERPPHPKRLEFFNLLNEGLTPWKAGMALGIWRGTYQYWLKQR